MRKLIFIKSKLIKPKFFLGIPLAILSLELYFGALLGYFVTKFLAGKQIGHQGIIKSIVFSIGNYRLHFHHWLVGLGILISALTFNFSLGPFVISQLSCGFLGGLIFQGISSYPDWYKIIAKKK